MESYNLTVEVTQDGAVRHIHLDFPKGRRGRALRLLEGALPGVRAMDEAASSPTPAGPAAEPAGPDGR